MNKTILHITIIALMVNQAFSAYACTGTTLTSETGIDTKWAPSGQCCSLEASTFTQGLGVATCATTTAAGVGNGADSLATNCLQGYGFATGVCTVCTAGNTAAALGTAACAACPADFYCALGTAALTAIAPAACPGTAPAATSTGGLTGKSAVTDCSFCVNSTTYVYETQNSACVLAAGYTGVGGGCAKFNVDTPATCLACRAGFRLNGLVCTACATGCATCSTVSAAEVCATAAIGYYLTATFVVTPCPTNCVTCTFSTTVTCTGTAANYFVMTTALTVATPCAAGFSTIAAVPAVTAVTAQATFATSALGCLIACSAGCQSCATAGAAKCDVCLADWVYNSTTMLCTQLTDLTRDPSCATAVGTGPNDCLTCRSTDNRVSAFVPVNPTDTKGACPCKATFTDAQKYADATATVLADRSVCQQCGKLVNKCKAADLTIVDSTYCSTGAKQVDAMTCGLPADKPVGFVYDAATSAFVACDGSCATCVKAGLGACLTCKDPAAVTPPSTDVSTLIKAWSNGTLPTTGGNCYLTCPTPGYVVDEARTACVAESNGLILSIISIISIVLLI